MVRKPGTQKNGGIGHHTKPDNLIKPEFSTPPSPASTGFFMPEILTR